MKILNLYAGIGGNRRLWGDEHDVTAVEFDPEIASVYAALFPRDTVLVEDAHAFLTANFDEFDFIWTSPPCTTHSRARHAVASGASRRQLPKYADMKLYEEIIFLQSYHRGGFVVENVQPYYNGARPLIPSSAVIGRHLYWTNFPLMSWSTPHEKLRDGSVGEQERRLGFDLSPYPLTRNQKRQALRNAVTPEVGEFILARFLEVRAAQAFDLVEAAHHSSERAHE